MNPSTSSQCGVLLLAHGARDPRWALPFEAVLQRLRESLAGSIPAEAVSLCFLEFMSPGIVAAGHALAASGCDEIHLVPLFLGGGGHVRKDIPALLAELQQAHPGVRWLLHPPVGEAPAVIDALAATALALLGSGAAPEPGAPSTAGDRQ